MGTLVVHPARVYQVHVSGLVSGALEGHLAIAHTLVNFAVVDVSSPLCRHLIFLQKISLRKEKFK